MLTLLSVAAISRTFCLEAVGEAACGAGRLMAGCDAIDARFLVHTVTRFVLRKLTYKLFQSPASLAKTRMLLAGITIPAGVEKPSHRGTIRKNASAVSLSLVVAKILVNVTVNDLRDAGSR